MSSLIAAYLYNSKVYLFLNTELKRQFTFNLNSQRSNIFRLFKILSKLNYIKKDKQQKNKSVLAKT